LELITSSERTISRVLSDPNNGAGRGGEMTTVSGRSSGSEAEVGKEPTCGKTVKITERVRTAFIERESGGEG
jgi:hypothetical protein